MSAYAKMQKSIANYYHMIKEQYSVKYMREAFIGILLVVCLGGGYFLHKFYVVNRERQAFVALSEVVHSFLQSQQQAQSLENVDDKEKNYQAWQDTEILLDALYKENINSYLAPYFLVFKAQIVLERDHDLNHALTIMDDALANVSKNSELGSFYHMKRIKMAFDSSDSAVRAKALADLIAFSKDEKSYVYQEALYELGLYYLSIGENEKAMDQFSTLVKTSDTTDLLKSPWVFFAQEKLGLVPTQDDMA